MFIFLAFLLVFLLQDIVLLTLDIALTVAFEGPQLILHG
jgi:hypothetical protein